MSLPPVNHSDPDTNLENWDLRAKQIQSEEAEKQTLTEQEFRSGQAFKELESIVSPLESGKNILDAIVTNYGKTEDLADAIKETFTSTASLKRLGISLEKSKRELLVSSLISELGLEETLIPGNFEEAIVRESDEMPEQTGIEEFSRDSSMPKEEVVSQEHSKDTREISGIPRLQRLVGSEVISSEEFEQVTSILDQEISLLQAVSDVVTDSGRRKEISSVLQSPESPEQRKEKFYQDMPQQARESEGDTIMDLIAENYTTIPVAKGVAPNREADFKTAVQEAANKIAAKNFPKPEGFDIAMKTIKTGENKEGLYIALGEVFSYANNSIGTQGKTVVLKQRRLKEEKGKVSAKKEITFRELIAQAKENAEKSQEAKIQKVMAIKEAEKNDTVEVGELDIMGGGELDVFTENPTSPNKAA